LYFIAMKLRHYLLPRDVFISGYDLFKHILTKHILINMIRRWIMDLSEFSLTYVPRKAIKDQALTDYLTKFLANYPNNKEAQELCEIGCLSHHLET